MSGGQFDYIQDRLKSYIPEIENIIEEYKNEFSKETIDEFRKAIPIIKLAAEYLHRIDWLISGDDGEDIFHEKLNLFKKNLGD